ncbi:MAG: type 3 dihydrofolate reductase [Gammaproteobacteria bacterium]
MKISLIVAMAENRAIGKDNQLPWRLSADLKNFKKLTTGKPVIMGRKTFESIGKALPDRLNIVLTRDSHFSAENCTVVHSLEAALTAASGAEEVMIMGGAQLYEQTLHQIDKIYLTLVHAQIDGDAFFPKLNSADWLEISRESFEADEKNTENYSFVVLERR